MSMDNHKIIEVYTDGACRGNPGLGAWAFSYKSFIMDSNIQRSGAVKNTTNNCMELTAIKIALIYIKLWDTYELEKIKIYSDSKYSIEVITKWSKRWMSKEFESRPNGELIKQINDLIKFLESVGIQVEFIHVRGHSGIEGNELVDRLCNEAIDKFIRDNMN